MKSCRPALGTYVVIRVEDNDPDHARQAIDLAFQAIDQVQCLMSAHAKDSELSRINRHAHEQAVHVHPWTYAVLELAKTIHTASEGLFDCCVGQHLKRWQMLPDHGQATSTHLPIQGEMRDLSLLDNHHVSTPAPLHLDLSGIAKGFAVDRAMEALQTQGVTNALVNAGGDLRVMGSVEEPVYVRSALDPRQLQLAGHLQNGAFATSGSYFSAKHATSGETVSALIDPKRQKPIISQHSFSVIAPSCAVADALTKVLAVGQNPEHVCFAQFGAQALLH